MDESRFPFTPYPGGWYRVASSSTLTPGAVAKAECFGEQLVVFRTESGKPRVISAFCPHMGVHLGEGGKVDGEAIACPMHGWRLSGEGKVVDVPYRKAAPPRVCVPARMVRELNGQVLIWNHPDGAAPSWDPPVLSEAEDPRWTSFRLGKHWRIRSHVQEFSENGVDNAHTTVLHQGRNETRAVEIDGPLYVHRTSQYFDGLGFMTIAGEVDLSFYALGICVQRGRVEKPFPLEYTVVFYATPVDGEWIDVQTTLAIKRMPTKLSTNWLWKRTADEIARVIEEDVPIWESKRYMNRPVLVPEDGPIASYRNWCRQFYGASDSA